MSEHQYTPFETLIIQKVDDLDEKVNHMDEKLTLVRIDVAALKVKAGIWGAAAGMIPAIITALAVWIGGAGGPS
jgi:hypothetical protein